MAVTLGSLAVRYGCTLRGDPARAVERVATLRDANGDAITFLANPAYRRQLGATGAGAVILTDREAADCPTDVLIAANPYAVFARVAQELHPPAPVRPGTHPTALVGRDCEVPASCEIGPNAVLGDRVRLGERVVVGAGAMIGDGVTIAADSRIFPSVVLYPGVRIGERGIVHAGAVIGADGFGFARERDATYVKVPQLGGVIIGDDVEVGANTTIDRGALGDTIVADGVKLDNQIQVGHNVRIGPHTVIAAQCGISGSTTIGSRCMVGGQAGFAGHITVTDDVVISGGAAVTGSIDKPGYYGGGGTPADDLQRWRRNMVRFGQLDDIARRLKAVEKTLTAAGKGDSCD